MTPKWSPGTSLMAKVIVFAGYAYLANFPPFTLDKCFLTELISDIVAPHLNKSWVKSCFSSKLMFFNGETNNEEPPPEIKTTNKSSFLRGFIKLIISLVASKPALSGVGCEASII